MYKIVINSIPRSGSTFLFNMIRRMYSHDKRDMMNPSHSGEWLQSDNWIILTHEPIIFRADFGKEITMTTVLRNPIDQISSQITKTVNGFSNRTIAGRSEILDRNIASFKEDQEDYIKEAIYQECKMWEGHTYGAMLAMDRLVPFTFEQVTQNTAEVLYHLYNIAGHSENYTAISKENVDYFIKLEKEYYKNDINFTSGVANSLPTEKPEEYYIIKDMVLSHPLIGKLLSDYEEAKEAFYKRQSSLGIIF